MSSQSTNKADAILDAAADLFARRPFHEVRLEDIAANAKVGKGTVYLYWTSKEDVYLAVVRRGFAAVVERVERELPICGDQAWDQISAILNAVIDFAFTHPGVYRIMRSGVLTPEDPELQRIRQRLTDRIEGVLRDGVASGQLSDECPALTTQYLLSFVRGAVLYPVPGMTADSLRTHVLGILRGGIDGGRPA